MVRLNSPASPESTMTKIDRELAGGEVISLDGAAGIVVVGCGFGVEYIDAPATALARSVH